MQKSRVAQPAAILAAMLLSGCGGGSDRFAPPPTEPPPPAGPPPLAVEQAFTSLAFEDPLAMLQPPDDSNTWYVVEKGGIVWRFPNDPDVLPDEVSAFIDLTNRVNSAPSEAGLLGMAFHPDFANNDEVFLSYTRSAGGLESVISRFTVNPSSLTLDPSSEVELLTVAQVGDNHNGGHLAFGPDGFLYAGFGDGGGSGDPQDNGQDPTTILGTIIRIDVDAATTPYAIPADNPFFGNTECPQGVGSGLECPEVYAFGFRNPWRFSFDRETDELWVGDVGEDRWEEVDRVAISENYGWNEREGAHCFDPPEDCDTNNVDPITEYGHDVGSSITGGYVYRGSEIPALRGFYVFGDFVSGRIWVVPSDSEQGVEPEELLDTNLRISSFAESNDGEIFILHFTAGTMYRLTADQ